MFYQVELLKIGGDVLPSLKEVFLSLESFAFGSWIVVTDLSMSYEF